VATNATQLAKSGKFGDLRRRLVFLVLALVVYRIGTHIPVPLEALKKEGEAGRRKITQYTRYGTLGLAIFQALGIAIALEGSAGLVIAPGFGFRLTAVVSLVAGTMFLMWLGEQITERGLGNGISILIFAGIAAGLPGALAQFGTLVSGGSMSIFAGLLIVFLVVATTYAVVFVERGQRKILVNYAKRQVGNKVYGGQSSHLPLKLNMAGVIPPIFASSIYCFTPQRLFSSAFFTPPWYSTAKRRRITSKRAAPSSLAFGLVTRPRAI